MGISPGARSKSRAKKVVAHQRAVFLDRDGTIIRQVELPRKPSQLRLLAGAADAIKRLKKEGYFTAIISNQPVVARGILTPAGVVGLNEVLLKRLAARGAGIDAFYFCPHHPNADVRKYRKACACRKPNPGMILEAARRHRIDLRKSFFIGDTTQDVLAGRNAGVRTILVRTGHGGRDPWQYKAKPDFIAKDLPAAARLIGRLSKGRSSVISWER